jgi:hypothetical protein
MVIFLSRKQFSNVMTYDFDIFRSGELLVMSAYWKVQHSLLYGQYFTWNSVPETSDGISFLLIL